MITTSKAAMQDVYDLINDDYFVMDIEKDLFVVFECIEESDEITLEEGSLIVRVPRAELLASNDVTNLIARYYLKALEGFDQDLYLQVKNHLHKKAA